MCGSEDLIHDARQVDLEETIKMNETPMYLVPGRLTDEQDTAIRREMIDGPILGPADMFVRLVGIVGTPVQPCADVETVAWEYKKPGCLPNSTVSAFVAERRKQQNMPVYELVRRADMEAQVALAYEKGWVAGKRDACNQQARVAADKDAEISRLLAKQPLYDRAVHENGELKAAVAKMQAQDEALTQVIDERDQCEQVISDLYHAAMGEYPDWSNNFGYRDAVEDVVDYVHALRTKALNEGSAG